MLHVKASQSIRVQNKNKVQVSITSGNGTIYPDKGNVKYKIN